MGKRAMLPPQPMTGFADIAKWMRPTPAGHEPTLAPELQDERELFGGSEDEKSDAAGGVDEFNAQMHELDALRTKSEDLLREASATDDAGGATASSSGSALDAVAGDIDKIDDVGIAPGAPEPVAVKVTAAVGEGAGVAAPCIEFAHKPAVTACDSLAMLTTLARPICGKCGWECDPLRSQIKSKCLGKWLCNACNSKQFLLHKICGTWPTAEFKGLSDSDQQQFWRDSHSSSNGQQLKNQLVNHLTRRRVDAITARISGAFLPISVYKAQGFDTDRIEANCHDFKDHPILGKVYRVPVESLERASVEEKVREQILTSIDEKTAAIHAAATASASASMPVVVESVLHAPHHAHGTTSDSSSDESTSSDSSSDSSRHKKKSKHRKSKKHKKSRKTKKSKKAKHAKKDDTRDVNPGAVVKQRKEGRVKVVKDTAADDAMKLRRAAGKKVQSEAAKVLRALAHPIWTVDQDMHHKLFGKIAAFASDAVKKSHASLVVMRAESQRAMDQHVLEHVAPLPWTFDVVAEAVKTALHHSAVVKSMVASAEAHFGK